MKHRSWSLLIVALLVACASLVTPTSFDQQLAYTLGQTTAVRKTCIDLLDRSRISPNTGVECLTQTNAARSAVQTAKVLGDSTGGRDQLEIAQRALVALETYLKEKEGVQ